RRGKGSFLHAGSCSTRNDGTQHSYEMASLSRHRTRCDCGIKIRMPAAALTCDASGGKGSMTPADRGRARRLEFICIIALVVIFACFTWRSLQMFFSDDDMLNLYYAWTTPALKIWKAQILPWMPISRPLGTAIYRLAYEMFGFHPFPLYGFSWLLLLANLVVAWR